MTSPMTEASFPRAFAILVASEAIGGAERYLVELAVAMSRSGTRPIVLNLKRGMAYEGELDRHHVKTRRGIAQNRFDPGGFLRLVQVLREEKPDVLLINSNRQALLLGALASRLCHIPVTLIHTHDHIGPALGPMRILAGAVDGVVAAAPSHRAYLCKALRLPPDRVAFVYPGINVDRMVESGSVGQSRTGRAAATVGIIAALRPEKDHETFLKAAALIADALPQARFLIAGDGPRRHLLETMASSLGLADRIQFLGWQRVDEGLLGRMDALALSSMHETFPAVILEAFACGVPVTVTDVGSVRDLLGSPPCGLLVPPGDPTALASAISSLLRDPGLAERLSRAGRERLGAFSAERFCRDMIVLSQRIGERKRAGARLDISRLMEEGGARPSLASVPVVPHGESGHVN